MQTSRRGFTLIELSIIITIVALVIGAVLVGRSVMRNSELQSVTTDAQKYISVIRQFRDKYRYLPGDMPNAEDFWGTNTNSSGSFETNPPCKETLNGDGNGIIEAEDGESFPLWQHLANAGFIDGMYNGVSTFIESDQGDVLAGYNVPGGAVKSSAFHFPQHMNAVSSAQFFAGLYNNYFALVASGKSNTQYPVPILTAEDAASIDQKMDDGRPGTGKVMGWVNMNFGGPFTGNPICSTTDDASTAEYAVSVEGRGCSVLFKTQ